MGKFLGEKTAYQNLRNKRLKNAVFLFKVLFRIIDPLKENWWPKLCESELSNNLEINNTFSRKKILLDNKRGEEIFQLILWGQNNF